VTAGRHYKPIARCSAEPAFGWVALRCLSFTRRDGVIDMGIVVTLIQGMFTIIFMMVPFCSIYTNSSGDQ